MNGACMPLLFLCISLLINGVHTGFSFGLTIFPSYHMFPQILKDSSTDVSLSPAPGCGGYCIPGPPAQDQLTNPRDWPCVPCPLIPCAQKPQPRGSSRRGRRVRVNNVSHVGVTLTVCLVTSTPLVVPPHYVGSPSQSPWSLWEGMGSFPCLFAGVWQHPSPGDLPHSCSSVPDLRTGSAAEPGRGIFTCLRGWLL